MRRTATILISVAIFCASLASSACADSPSARFRVWFTPNRPGANTTIHFGFRIRMSDGSTPPPLVSVKVSLPPGLEGTPTLGQVVCEPLRLQLFGEAGCSPNALMGRGHADVRLAFGDTVINDASTISIFMGPPIQRHTTMVFLATSRSPVFAEVLFHGSLLPDPSSPEGALLQAAIPLVPSVPGAPYVSVVSMETTLGPENITYFRDSHGKRIAFEPEGLALPAQCPRRGFPFVGTLGFVDGTTIRSTYVAQCNRSASQRHRR
jgi:hypothetical protein